MHNRFINYRRDKYIKLKGTPKPQYYNNSKQNSLFGIIYILSFTKLARTVLILVAHKLNSLNK